MDSRIALKNGYVLQLQGKYPVTYTIGDELGRGASCIVYDATYETALGDIKHVRLKECYPYKVKITREETGALTADDSSAELFESAKSSMRKIFSVENSLFYSGGLYDSLVNMTDILQGNNTVYIVSTFSGTKNLAEYRPKSLKECVALIKNTAGVIKKIHEHGYLYLDVKPENILVVEGVITRIMLFDFDSLWAIPGSAEGGSKNIGRISFTKGYAALELQLGKLKELGTYTDSFGVGALLYYLLFNSAPDSLAGMYGAKYPYEKANYMDVPYRDTLFPLLTDFFHKTLAAYYPDRYSDMDDVISALDAIEKNADITEPYIISSVILPPVCFFGRKRELEALDEWWRDGNKSVLYVTGIGGIGKSTVVRQFIASLDKAPDAVLFFSDSGNLMSSVIDDSVIQINTVERRPEESDEDYYIRKLKELRKYIAGKKVLAVIDNFVSSADQQLSELKKLGWKLILASGEPAPADAESVKIEAISDTAVLRALFEQNLGRRLTQAEMPPFQIIKDTVGGHTLIIELLAKQIRNSALTMTEASELLNTRGFTEVAEEEVCMNRDDTVVYGTVSRLLNELFKFDKLSEDDRSVLKTVFLLGHEGISADEFKYLSGIENLNAVNRLIRLGWINTSGMQLSMHPVIAELVDNRPFSEPVRQYVRTAASRLFLDIRLESKKEDCPKDLSENLRGIADDRFYIRKRGQRKSDGIEHVNRQNKQTEKTDVTDLRKLQYMVNTAWTLLKGCEPDVELTAAEIMVNLRAAAIDNATMEHEELILAETDRLLSICRSGRFMIPPVAYMRLLGRKAEIYENRGDIENAYTIVREVARRAARSLSPQVKAEYHVIAATFYETKLCAEDRNEDKDKFLTHINRSVEYTRLAPWYAGKEKELCDRLVSKAIVYSRLIPEADLDSVLEEAEGLVSNNSHEYSESRYGLCMARAWYCVEKYQDIESAEKYLSNGVSIAERTSTTFLEYIDKAIIPVAQMYFDVDRLSQAEHYLSEGIRICDENIGLLPYVRKKYDLLGFRLEVAISSRDQDKIKDLMEILDEIYKQYADLELPYYITPYLQERLRLLESQE